MVPKELLLLLPLSVQELLLLRVSAAPCGSGAGGGCCGGWGRAGWSCGRWGKRARGDVHRFFRAKAHDTRCLIKRVRPWEINHRFIHPVSPQAKSILLLGKSILNCPARGGFLAGGCVLLPIWAIFGLKLGPHTPPKGAQKWARNMPPKDRIWVTKRRRSRVSDRLGTNPAGIRMFRVAANGSWSGCWAQTGRFGASRFVPKIAKNGRKKEKTPRRPGLCCPTCPNPDRRK